MSYTINPLEIVSVKAPLIKVNEKRKFPVLKGGAQISYKPVISSSYSNSSMQFTAPPPSPSIFVDRRIHLKVPVTIDFTGTAPVGQNLIQSGFDAFRAYPLSSIINTLTATINNNASTINMSDVIQPLLRYNTGRDLAQGKYSTTPSMMDKYQRYESGDQTTINPLAQYAENTYQTPRGGFPMTINSNTNTTASVSAVLTEPLFLSPLLFGQKDRSGFIGVQTMDFNFTFDSNLGRIWSHSDGSGSTLITVTVTIGQPTLLFKYVTPDPLSVIPKSVVYSYYDVQRYPTDANTPITSGSTATFSSANIQVQSIPRRMYIFARQRNADRTFNSTDTFFSLENISINWNNRAGLLSSASKEDLYLMSKKNGFDGSYAEWSGGPVIREIGASSQKFGTVGSVFCVEFGTDIGLGALETPGMLGTYQLQYNATFKNVNQVDTIIPTLYTIIISEGTFTIQENRSIAQIGVVSKQDVLDAELAPEVEYDSLDEMYGGNFFSGLKDISNSVLDVAKKALPIAREGFSIAKDVAPYAAMALPLLGLGEQDAQDRLDESIAMKKYWASRGGRKPQTARDRLDESEGMRQYWDSRRGGVVVGGMKKFKPQTNKDKEDEARAMLAYWAAKNKKGGKKLSRAQLSKRLK